MMQRAPGLLPRLVPVMLVAALAMSYAAWVERTDAYLGRNLIPMLLLVTLAAVALHRGKGRWRGNGWHWPLAIIGFAVPTLGLSLYLHYGYTVDMNGMVSESIYPQEVFRYLPIYTTVAGAIGFSIGWIAGKNVN